MTTKEKMRQVVEGLPVDATIEDAMGDFLFLAKVEKGLQQAKAEEVIAHAEVQARMAKWLK